jgi:hypothetical protein
MTLNIEHILMTLNIEHILAMSGKILKTASGLLYSLVTEMQLKNNTRTVMKPLLPRSRVFPERILFPQLKMYPFL